MDSIDRAILDRKADAWRQLAADMRGLAESARAERDRLLGPDRGH